MIGERDKQGNISRLYGKQVQVWQTPDGFEIRLKTDPKVFTAVSTESEAVTLYNEIEGAKAFALPALPTHVNPIPGEPDAAPIGGRILGKFESKSTPGEFHYVTEYGDGAIRCDCWPFIRKRTCQHYEFVQAALDQGANLETPIVLTYNRGG